MKIEHMPAEFQAALPILETIEAAGFEAYFVGGSVRDTLLGKPIHDVDIATSAYPEEVKALFDRTVDTGIQHGTVMILDHGTGYETTTFRTESTYTDFRRPDEVTFVRSLAEDLKRRDFTVNAFALTKEGEVIDMFDGLTDLHNQVLRAVGAAEERFHEDALRMMRAVRFAAQLGFEIEAQTLTAITENAPLLANIAIERINVEFTKLLQGKAAKYGVLEMVATKLHQFMPGLQDAAGDLTAYAQLLEQDQSQTDTAAWTLLAFELGLDAKATGQFLKLWKHANDLIKQAKASIELLAKIQLNTVTAWDLYATHEAIDNALAVAQLSELDADVPAMQVAYHNLTIKNKAELAFNGGNLTQELQLKPGPLFGKILATLEREVVAGTLPNTHDALLAAATEMVEKAKN